MGFCLMSLFLIKNIIAVQIQYLNIKRRVCMYMYIYTCVCFLGGRVQPASRQLTTTAVDVCLYMWP